MVSGSQCATLKSPYRDPGEMGEGMNFWLAPPLCGQLEQHIVESQRTQGDRVCLSRRIPRRLSNTNPLAARMIFIVFVSYHENRKIWEDCWPTHAIFFHGGAPHGSWETPW
jgi:hypothetical protein